MGRACPTTISFDPHGATDAPAGEDDDIGVIVAEME
jgi:hypothetical protein